MVESEDPRLAATRIAALDAALGILMEEGVLAVTHASIGKQTGISRSTLYRHWPDLAALRNAVFIRAASGPKYESRTNGPLKKDLTWILGKLVTALNESDWGRVAPQIVGIAGTDAQARELLKSFMQDRIDDVESIFEAAQERGELKDDAPVRQMIEMVIALPYFRKFVADLPLDKKWQKAHVELICKLAMDSTDD